MKRINIGRDNSCDIVITDPLVSRVHAIVTLQDGVYSLKDISTNGTKVNGCIIQQNETIIKPGDSIYLANSVMLPWQKITRLLPNDYAEDRHTHYGNQGDHFSNQQNNPKPSNYNSWSWGGFCFGWLWAVCNGILWPLLGLIFPVAFIVINVILGINGNKWAWENKHWESTSQFEKTQHQWAIAALVVFLICVVLPFIVMFILAAAGA